MTQAATPNMALVQPDEGGSSDVWDVILTTLFGVVDAHNHTAGKGLPVPSAGLRINADVAWAYSGTSYSITALKAVDFTPVTAASVAALAGAFFVSSADNELYFRSIAGTNIKLTNAGTINISLVGGIGGDYSSIGALFSYDDATDSYWAQQEISGGVRKWARLRAGDIDIYETAASITNRIRLRSPAALAASYELVFPAAVPGAAAAVQVSTAGVLTFSNTFAGNLTAADHRYTTEQSEIYAGVGWIDPNATHTRLLSGSGAQIGWTLAASANPLTMQLHPKEGDTITGYRAWVNKVTNGSATIACKLWKQRTGAIGTESAVTLGTGTETSALNAPGYIQLISAAVTELVAAGWQYYAVMVPSGSVTTNPDQLLSLELFHKRL